MHKAALYTIISILFSCQAFAQVGTPEVRVVQILTFTEGGYEPVDGANLLVDENAKYTTRSAGVVDIESEASIVSVRAYTEGLIKVDTVKRQLDTPNKYSYFIFASGKVLIEITCIDFDKKIYEERQATLVIGPPEPPPPPPPPPPPDVPEDEFDNIGQRVAEWCAGLTGNEKVGLVYKAWADKLANDPSLTIGTASKGLEQDLSIFPSHREVLAKVKSDTMSRWANIVSSKQLTANYWDAISKGFGL